jgi:tetratricopeptide (TPR) repeat protein
MMRIIFSLLFVCLLLPEAVMAQFHTLKYPESSNFVQETQRLGVTDITITYHSPRTRGRDVWNNPGIIPPNGNPIAWRAGANMNTTISFSTDVMIEGKALAAGEYGFHVIPKNGKYTLLFAHNSQQWGSYYLDVEKDVTLQVEVEDTTCSFSEKLDYEFYHDGEDAMIIGLEWGDKRLPFRVSVDLNKVVVASFREELRGQNTYRWEAWDDAASWCLNHNTNLEEALTWAERSVSGGYNGFGANQNFTNMTTQARLLQKLGKTEKLDEVLAEMESLNYSSYEANGFTIFLLQSEKYQEAMDFCEAALDKEEIWFFKLNKGLCHYFLGDTKAALKGIKAMKDEAPAQFHGRIDEILVEVEEGRYKLPPAR